VNCKQARERILESLGNSQSETKELREHLAGCPACRSEWQHDREVWEKLRPAETIVASHQLMERTMTAITIEAAKESSERSASKWRSRPRWVMLAVAAVLLVVLIPLLPLGNSNRAGVALLAQSLQAMSKLRSVHISGQMRTVPGDNFELIGTDYQFVPLEMWRDYGPPTRWRVEKPGRVVVMDGQQSLLYLSKNHSAMKGEPTTGFVQWLRPLMSPETVLAGELAAAKRGEAEASLTEANGQLTLRITRQAQGDFTNDWVKNKAIDSSDHTRVYRFDSATKLLTGLSVVVHTGGQDISVLELNSFTYDQPLPDTLFALALPADVNWMLEPSEMPAAPSFTGPREAAEFFFDSLAREDWQKLLQVLPGSSVPDGIKNSYGGLNVVHLGDAFQSGLYPGWFVPYQIRLRNGETKDHKLAIRNDNPQRRWVVDGGF
jgi:outer membrane lipoprotein-sorting protein